MIEAMLSVVQPNTNEVGFCYSNTCPFTYICFQPMPKRRARIDEEQSYDFVWICVKEILDGAEMVMETASIHQRAVVVA